MNLVLRPALMGLFLFALPNLSMAQEAAPSPEAAWDAAVKAAFQGPTDIPLEDQAKLHLTSDMIFVPKAEGARLMQAWGNSVGENFDGLVFPKSDQQNWAITIDFVAEGYVKDDDAKTWNADELMQGIKQGNEAQNEKRAEMGIAPLDIVGWVQPPQYDASRHQLVWSLKGMSRGAAADVPATINYNTYALGREGYFEVNLLTDDKHIDADKAFAHQVIKSVEYNEGKRYADFNAATDHIAEYGLAALVGGVAAKKLGLLAVIGVFFAKFAKIIIAALVVGGGALTKLFRRNTA